VRKIHVPAPQLVIGAAQGRSSNLKRVVIGLVAAFLATVTLLGTVHPSVAREENWVRLADGNLDVVSPAGAEESLVASAPTDSFLDSRSWASPKDALRIQIPTLATLGRVPLQAAAIENQPDLLRQGVGLRRTGRFNGLTRAYMVPSGVPVRYDYGQGQTMVVFSDPERQALWVFDAVQDRLSKLTSDQSAGYDRQALWSAIQEDSHGAYVTWAYAPKVSPEGREVYYLSSRNGDPNQNGLSVWVMGLDGTNDRLVVDAETLGSEATLQLLHVSNQELLLYEGKGDTLLLSSPSGQDIRTVVSGYLPIAVSPLGDYVVVRRIQNGTASASLSAIRVRDGSVIAFPELPAPLGFMNKGAWSPDGRKFAYYANDFRKVMSEVLVLVEFRGDRLEQRIVAGAPDRAHFDPSGTLQWLNPGHLIVYLTNGESWVLRAGGND
jgi:hypothetical protein